MYFIILTLFTKQVLMLNAQSIPDAPRNVSIVNVTDTVVSLRWLPPANPNGDIKGYRIYFTNDGLTSVDRLEAPLEQLTHVLHNLKPFANYSIAVKAFTRSEEGVPSTPSVEVRTDVAAPSAPLLASVTCQPQLALLVRWLRPALYHSNIDYYLLEHRRQNAPDELWHEQRITADPTIPHNMFLLANLTDGVVYAVRVRAATRSLLRSSLLRVSPHSVTLHAPARSRCPASEAVASDVWRRGHAISSSMDIRIVASVALAGCAVLLLLLAVVLWRRYLSVSYLYLEEPVSSCVPLHKEQSWERDGPNGAQAPVLCHLFPAHVSKMHADSDIGFCKEYDEILEHTMKLGLSADISQMEENKSKNRYQNIDAYDHSLVPLHPLPGQRRGDYINANYMDGFLTRWRYIGAQGPLPNTLPSFWRLVWEQCVHVIVMITNLVERSRKKCDQYWPKEGGELYGMIHVELLEERVFATYTVRKFSIRHTKVKCRKKRKWHERLVYQYHYTNWPDHGVPDHPLPILNFVRKSSAANPDQPLAPILVHCSAGVGRTGTYIVLDAMCAMLRRRGACNVFGFLKHIRSQRNFVVQTEDQYVFVHDALLEAINAGDTCVPADGLTVYIQQLSTAHATTSHYPSYTLHQQYQLVTGYQPKEYELCAAQAGYNLCKNRNSQFVPVDQWRVQLAPRPTVQGSDYINATILLGYEKLQEYIITQHPLAETVEDFWRMIWDHNVQTVVVLSPPDEQEYAPFWPGADDGVDSDCFRVRMVEGHSCSPAGCSCPDSAGCRVLQMQLQSTQDDYQMSVRVLCAPGWPHALPAAGAGSAHELLKLVQRLAQLSYQNGPLVVVDRYGGTEAATFCCLSTLYRQYLSEQAVDVYMYAKLYHLRRPGIWQTQDDFTFLYHSMEGVVRADCSCNGIAVQLPEEEERVALLCDGMSGCPVQAV